MTVAITRPTLTALASPPVSEATEKMRREGLPQIAIDTFAHYERLLREGHQGTLPEAELEPLTEVPSTGRPPGGGSVRARARGRAQAERRARHQHGDDEGEVPARGEGRAHLPRRDRAPGAPSPRAPRGGDPAAPDEQLRHARRHAGRARALPGPEARGPAARLRPGQGAEAARGHPRAGRLGGRSGARVGAAGTRRRVHLARHVGDARHAAGARLRVPVPVELGQPRRGARAAHPRLVRARGPAVRLRGRGPRRGRPQGRPPRAAARGRPASCCARPRRCRRRTRRRSRTRTGIRSSTRTASG